MIVASVLVTVAFLFALRALLMGVTYVALSYRYFLRPHKFGLPSGWYLLWLKAHLLPSSFLSRQSFLHLDCF